MNILIATSEAVPFAKTGGLADVTSALAIELNNLGHQPCLVLPAYSVVLKKNFPITDTGKTVNVNIENRVKTGQILQTFIPDTNIPVYLINQTSYFERAGLYNEDDHDFTDNCERFIFFAQACIQLIAQLNLDIDVIHCNDWQTGLIPAYLKLKAPAYMEPLYSTCPSLKKAISVYTVHNLAYQGTFWHWDMPKTGIDWSHFNYQEMEAYGRLNFLKSGLVYSDLVTTVSPTYARETMDPEHGCGLDGALKYRHQNDQFVGILNGMDVDSWNPETDPNLATNYSVNTWKTGKAACKAQVQKQFGLPIDPDIPLIGTVGRLSFQKGFDLVAEAVRNMSTQPGTRVQWVILGTGEKLYQDMLTDLSREFSDRMAIILKYSDSYARQIYAGSDIFVMPSRYEPCGLAQMYALRYGTLPVVHRTGGLADTIVNKDDESLRNNTANGFSYGGDCADGFIRSLQDAVYTFTNCRPIWETLLERGMRQDWSWGNSAANYVKQYERIISTKESSVRKNPNKDTKESE